MLPATSPQATGFLEMTTYHARVLQTMIEAEAWRSLLLSLLAEVLLPDPDCEGECAQLMEGLLAKARSRFLAETLPHHVNPSDYAWAVDQALSSLSADLIEARQTRSQWRDTKRAGVPPPPLARSN